MRNYVTRSGDTWDMIAYKYMADGEKGVSRLIMQNSLFADVVRFPAGLTLNIPDDVYGTVTEIPPWRR